MQQKDNAYCGYNVGEAEKYGLIKAIILNQIRWYLRTLGKQFDRQKCWRTVKDLADDIGIPYDTVRKNLPTEEMGIKYYPGYKPGTMTRTTWWEECPRNGQIATSEMTSAVTSKEMTSAVISYNKEENKRKMPMNLPNGKFEGVHSSSSSSVDRKEIPSPNFSGVVDLKSIKRAKKSEIGFSEVEALCREGGKKDKITGVLINHVRRQSDKFGYDTLMDCVKRVKFRKFYATLSLQALLADGNIQGILNLDNEVKDDDDKGYSGIRVEVEPMHFVPVELVDTQFPYFEFTKDTEYIETVKEVSPEGYVKFKEMRYKIDPETGEHYDEHIVENK